MSHATILSLKVANRERLCLLGRALPAVTRATEKGPSHLFRGCLDPDLLQRLQAKL